MVPTDCGRAPTHRHAAPCQPGPRVGIDLTVSDLRVAKGNRHPRASLGRIAINPAVADRRRRRDDIDAGTGRSLAKLAGTAKTRRVAAGDVQTLHRRACVANDANHPAAPPGVQGGGIRHRVRRSGKGLGITALDRQRLAEIKGLGKFSPSAHAHAGPRHLDQVRRGAAGVDRVLDRAIIGRRVVQARPATALLLVGANIHQGRGAVAGVGRLRQVDETGLTVQIEGQNFAGVQVAVQVRQIGRHAALSPASKLANRFHTQIIIHRTKHVIGAIGVHKQRIVSVDIRAASITTLDNTMLTGRWKVVTDLGRNAAGSVAPENHIGDRRAAI